MALTQNDDGIYLGTFTIDGLELEILPHHYDALTDEEFETLEDKDLIKAVEIIAMNEYYQANKLHGQEREDRFEENVGALRDIGRITNDPVPRFIGNVLIFDANNLAYRCRYAYDLSYNGYDVSVLFGFLKNLETSINKFGNVEAVIVCWDGGVPKFRRERIPEYKQRDHSDEEDWEDFNVQMKQLQDFLPNLGVCSVRGYGMEADDLVYHAAKLLHEDYLKIVISNDKDLLQTVRYDTIVYNPIADKEISNQNFLEEIGVKPADYLTFKSLIGDGSDNLKGCFGIGEKTAIKLIEEYNSPSNMLNAANGLNPEAKQMADGISNKLRQFGLKGFEDMMTVVRLDIDRIGAKQVLLKGFKHWKSYDHETVKDFLMGHGFNSLLEPRFYNAFRTLRSPRTLLKPEIGYKVRFPTIIGLRSPVSVSEEVVSE